MYNENFVLNIQTSYVTRRSKTRETQNPNSPQIVPTLNMFHVQKRIQLSGLSIWIIPL
jgi:hypothetical protein